MRYSKQLRLVRRARKMAKTQHYQLLALEVEGLVAITVHSATGTLTIPIERAAGAQVVDTLCEALRDRRRTLQTETEQLHQDWQESEALRGSKSPTNRDQLLPSDDSRP